MNLNFVLPSKNESATVPGIIEKIKDLAQQHGWSIQVYLVDDSDPDQRKILLATGATILDGQNKGLGYAMLKGLAAARKSSPDWIITLDSDGQVDLNEIPPFLEFAQKNKIDLLLSSRFLKGQHLDYPYPLINWIGNRMLVTYLRLVTRLPLTDSHGGLRIYNPKFLENLHLNGWHTYVQETIVQIARKGGKVQELPSRWQERRFSSSRVLKSILRYASRTTPALAIQAHCDKALLLLILIFVFFENWWLFSGALIFLIFLFWVSWRRVSIDDFEQAPSIQFRHNSGSPETSESP